jgi:hypothetical protein
MSNPETKVTDRLRRLLADAGCHAIKLSDSFTRGVPDMVVVSNRVIMVEVKVDRLKSDKTIREYSSLGLSGAQDHHVRQISRRCSLGACVVTDAVDGGKMRLWVPRDPAGEGPGFEDYIQFEKNERAIAWLTGRRT